MPHSKKSKTPIESPLFGNKTLLVCVDIQEKLINVMAEKERVLANATKILKASAELGLPMLISEQYPKGLGKTALDCGEAPTLEKETFSIFGNEQMAHFVRKSGCKTLVLFGIESHVCVFQSAVHALKLGYETIILADSCSSRDILCHNLAIRALSKKGATILPTETFIFGAMLGCKDAHFKAISAIVK